MSKLSFRARALDASKPMPIYLAEELPDLPDYSAINRAVPQMPSGMEKEEESEHHLQRAISGTGLIIPTPEVCQVSDLEFYERCYPPDYKMPKQHIHMQPLWEEQEAPEYDIDSEDERWLKQQRHPELSELKFEQMMDKLERCSGQTVVTLNEAKLLLERHDDLVIAVYDYWLNKRLNTQHALILSVKTENRPGQSSNNPYLAFRRRTEKMQTRKNRKNDESSYEKMLKLRRDLARALTLLELVARRESAKRDLVKLTALLSERRYAAGDFANHLLPDPPHRTQYTAVPITASSYRREAYSIPHYPPRPPPTPVDQPRQREKRSYKRRKHRHPAAGSVQGLRDGVGSGVGVGAYTSSEEEGGANTRTEPPPDDGPFAFRRKPGCYYEMPTSTLCGDPADPESPWKEGLFEHDLDLRNRYTLTSINHPYPVCVGMSRRRLCRGGRVALDRRATPLDPLWPRLPFTHTDAEHYRRQRDEEVELETKAHRTPKEMIRDYHSGGKYPWRHAFRRHLARNPDLWTVEVKPDALDVDDVKLDALDVKLDALDVDDVKLDALDVKPESLKMDVDELPVLDSVKSDISVSARTIDSAVRDNLRRVIRKRSWSGCSDSYDSDESLQPVEREFEKFINEVNKKWLHFRPKTPPPSPPFVDKHDDQFPIEKDTPITVELRSAEQPPTSGMDLFTTSQFTLQHICPIPDADNSGTSLDDDLLNNFTGLTEDQVESILSDTDLKTLADDDKKMAITEDLLEELVNNDPFLFQSQGFDGRADSGKRKLKADNFGSTTVNVYSAVSDDIYVDRLMVKTPPKKETPVIKVEKIEPAPVPTSRIIVEEVNEVLPIKIEKKRKDDTIEEIQLAHGVQLRTVQTKHSPVKKHIITSAAHRRPSDVTLVTSSVTSETSSLPQIVTVAVSDNLKVRLQNHLVSTQAGVLVQNGPFPPVAVLPVQQSRDGIPTVSIASTSSPRRISAPLVQLAPAPVPGPAPAPAHATPTLTHKQLVHHPHAHTHAHSPLVVSQSHTIHHVAPNKLKVLHAHPLTQTQRTQLLAQNRSIGQLPAVVSLATLGEATKGSTALLKAAPGSVAQLYEIKSGQLGKGPHLVNVVRQPQPGKTTVTRLDLNDKKRQVVATFDGTALKGNLTNATRTPHRVSVSVDGRQVVRSALPAMPSVRPSPLRHQLHLNNSRTIPAPIPTSVVHNLLQKGVQLPKAGPKIAISGPPSQPLSANVQAIAFTTAQLKAARQARLITQARPTPVAEIVEASTAPVATSSTSGLSHEVSHESREGEEGTSSANSNGTVRRRTGENLPMEVT